LAPIRLAVDCQIKRWWYNSSKEEQKMKFEPISPEEAVKELKAKSQKEEDAAKKVVIDVFLGLIIIFGGLYLLCHFMR
jgi:hypothetical protein